MSNETKPTETAMQAATAIDNFLDVEVMRVPGMREKLAITIDIHTQLPEKHAALLLAQGVVDNYDRGNADDAAARADGFDLLREALTRIGKQADSACGQKDNRENPPS
jgi:hypothetical protein